MEQQQHSPKFLKQRKLMMVLPLLVLPFLTFAFWMLGGGTTQVQSTGAVTGLNLNLPDASLKEERGLDKLSFYKAADQDSLKREEALRNDPYYRDSAANRLEQLAVASDLSLYDQRMPLEQAGLNTSPYNSPADSRERQVYARIAALKQRISQPDTPVNTPLPQQAADIPREQFSKDVDRLQAMMTTMGNKQEADPEMQQLNGTLEKILDIQHPERVRDRTREQSLKQKTQVFTVTRDNLPGDRSYFGNASLQDTGIGTTTGQNGFFGFDETPAVETGADAVPAVIHETQVLVAGSTVKLRLLSDVYIAGVAVASGSFVYGTASLNDERLTITIASIRSGNHLLPVALSVYDMDGMPGVFIPGSINRDAAKQAADQGLQGGDIISLDPSLAAQATSAGIQATKGLLSRKVKQVKVTVKAGYKVLLKDNNQPTY